VNVQKDPATQRLNCPSNRVRSTLRALPGKTGSSLFDDLAPAAMSADDFTKRYREMQKYVGWTDDDARRVTRLAPVVAPHAPALIDDFYAEIKRTPEAARVITGGQAQIERLSLTLREWLAQLLGGQYDEAYMARRWKVGYRHVEIGLAQRYTSLALSRLRSGIVSVAWAAWPGAAQELGECLASLHKLLDLDHALVQDAYEFEHVRRERSLERERSERMFRHLVESASCLIVILDANLQPVYFNPYAENVTGFAAAEVQTQPERALAALGDDFDATRRRIAEVLADGSPATFEVQFQLHNRPRHWINWTLTRMTDFADGDAVLAVGHDVTEQRHAAVQVLQASRLATIGEMYARLAHESRNALQRLRVCTEMLADQVAGQSAAESLLNRSQKAQDDLQRLLDEVRNFAAPIALERSECRMAGLWREAWSLLQQAHRDRGATLIDEPCDATLSVVVDRFRIVQAFRNIFENALAACGDPAVINVRCNEFSVDGRLWVEIHIDDNGPGFDQAATERAFEPFFTTKTTGTGLGLAIVRRIIEAHGGRIHAAAAALGGARLCITLPVEPCRSTLEASQT
jgi:two-component system sensor kinase FixL